MEEAPSLKTLLLAVLFAAGRPVALKELRALGHPEEAVLRALKALERDLGPATWAWPWSGWRGVAARGPSQGLGGGGARP